MNRDPFAELNRQLNAFITVLEPEQHGLRSASRTSTTRPPSARPPRSKRLRITCPTGNPLALSAENTMFANYYGLPAISLPMGEDARGLPLGLQIVGRPGDDAMVIEVARKFEELRGIGAPRSPRFGARK